MAFSFNNVIVFFPQKDALIGLRYTKSLAPVLTFAYEGEGEYEMVQILLTLFVNAP